MKKIPLFLLLALWGSISIFCLLKPADDFSVSERRKLAKMPQANVNSIISGQYFNDFETAALDQFPCRDAFRTLKSVSEFYLFHKKDNNDIYISDGYAAKQEYPLNTSSVLYAVKKTNDLYNTYGKDSSGNVYLSVVPDKGYFLAKKTGHLSPDYDALFDMVKDGLPFAAYIDLTPSLALSSYYKTDTHWRQEMLPDTAKLLADAMNTDISGKYTEYTIDTPFYGVYYGQSALPLGHDTIHYLSNEIMDSCMVYNAETNKTTGLYDFDKISGYDMYELFLSGAAPVLSIDNPKAVKKKELVVFRDSFASAIIPLLAEGYSKITLVDTRYIQPSAVGEYVDLSDADILFLYSTAILNNSRTLR